MSLTGELHASMVFLIQENVAVLQFRCVAS